MSVTPKNIIVYPGSFDPITNGHLDLIGRALKNFDEVHVGLGKNPGKKGYLTTGTRLGVILDSFTETGLGDAVEAGLLYATFYDGATIDWALRLLERNPTGSSVSMLRGLRTVTDFDSEFALAFANMHIAETRTAEVNTIFMVPRMENHYVSSSMIREMWSIGADISALVPKAVVEALQREKPRHL